MSDDTTTLRDATGDDRAFLLEVYASTRREELAGIPWSEAEKDAFLRMQFEAQDAHYRAHYARAEFSVIERGGVPIGRLYVHRGPREIRVMDIALLPEHRRHGHGGLLMRAIIEEARASGRSVGIHVEKANPALGLYERLGFRQTADREVYWFMEWRADPEVNSAG